MPPLVLREISPVPALYIVRVGSEKIGCVSLGIQRFNAAKPPFYRCARRTRVWLTSPALVGLSAVRIRSGGPAPALPPWFDRSISERAHLFTAPLPRFEAQAQGRAAAGPHHPSSQSIAVALNGSDSI